jgi:SOS response regulatory protein OraA/RecX
VSDQTFVETDDQKFSRLMQEAGFVTKVKESLTPEEKVERIKVLLVALKASKEIKDEKAGKKIRRQLRKLGFSIRKVMQGVNLEASI